LNSLEEKYNMKVLLVEDDLEISSFVQLGLEDNDNSIDVAYDGIRGEELALENKYDIIILDVMLPGQTGFEICKKIRKNNIETPVLIVTSLTSPEEKTKAFAAGANDFLLKPFNFKDLRKRIDSLIQKN